MNKKKKLRGGRSKEKCLDDWEKGVILYQCFVFYCELNLLSLLNILAKYAHENGETKY